MYDLIIVGGGPAAYSAGVYASRYNMNCLILSKQRGGLVLTTHLLENWPGEKSIKGFDLVNKFQDHVTSLGVEIKDLTVNEITKENEIFTIKTDSETFQAKTVILATGSTHREHPAEGIKAFHGRGVSYCATCDGMFFKDKIVAMIGSGDSAIKEAVTLSEISKKVYVISRSDKITAEPLNVSRLKSKEEKGKVEILYNLNVVEIVGDKKVEKIIFDKEHNGSTELMVDGVFVAIGQIPQSGLAKNLGVELNRMGEIIVSKHGETNIPGFYSAGDVTDFGFKQVITASSQGAAAVYSAFNYIQK